MKLLIADDEKNIRIVLSNELAGDGVELADVENGEKALDLLDGGDYDVLLLDLNMPGIGGVEVLKKMKQLEIPTEVVVLTADSTVSSAVQAIKLGAYNYLTKPFKFEELRPLIEQAYEKKRLKSENLFLKTQIRREAESRRIIVRSAVMLQLIETVKKIAFTELPVLIAGDSGTGKELIARLVHDESGRREGPFVAINCGAIPENMIESELFGYEKGAFTGAHARKPGLLEIAHTGTLFLDEIGDMPLPLQVKLLRVIETGAYFRLGGTRELRVSVRIVSATNKDLKAEIEKGLFRQELFYRISTLTLTIPPLRERPEDIPPLIEYCMSALPGARRKRFTPRALQLLSEYDWPGNVRELQNVVQRALLLSKNDQVDWDELPPDLMRGGSARLSRLEDLERSHILRVMRDSGGHRGKAASTLGIDPKTLYRKLRSYGIQE